MFLFEDLHLEFCIIVSAPKNQVVKPTSLSSVVYGVCHKDRKYKAYMLKSQSVFSKPFMFNLLQGCFSMPKKVDFKIMHFKRKELKSKMQNFATLV